MVAAGLKQQLGSMLRRLLVGWEGKNSQIALHAKVIGNTPAQPEARLVVQFASKTAIL